MKRVRKYFSWNRDQEYLHKFSLSAAVNFVANYSSRKVEGDSSDFVGEFTQKILGPLNSKLKWL